MEVFITGLIAPDLAGVCGPGASHPLITPLMDDGSHCTVTGVPAGAEGVAELLEAALAAGRKAGIPARRIDAFPTRETPGSDALHVLDQVLELDTAPNTALPSEGPAALCVLLGDAAGKQATTVILHARHLPSMGPMPPCSRDDLEATWVRLAGGSPATGRYLLEESSDAWDPEIEQQLTERLRQLYGD